MESTIKEEINIIKKEGSEDSFSSYKPRMSMYRKSKYTIHHNFQRHQDFKRGDIVFVSDNVFTNDIKNSMLQKSRPAIVIQNDVGNFHSKYLIVCYISTRLKNKYLPTHVYIDDIGVIKNSSVMAENIQSIHKDHCRIIGKVSPDLMNKIDMALAESIGLKSYIKNNEQVQKNTVNNIDTVSKDACLNSEIQGDGIKSELDSKKLLLISALRGKKHIFDIESEKVSITDLSKNNSVHLGTKEDIEDIIKELQEVLTYI